LTTRSSRMTTTSVTMDPIERCGRGERPSTRHFRGGRRWAPQA
jgi:hypothetical protein